MTIKLALLKLRSRQMFRLECYLLSLVLALMASPALAHSEAGVAIDFMDGDHVFLTSGVTAGEHVVTVGVPELRGAEFGVGEGE